MVEIATEKEKEELLLLNVQNHPAKDQVFFEQYFQDQFSRNKTYFLENDTRIYATMSFQEHPLRFQDKVLLCSYIFGVATHVDYRNQGAMSELMHYVLDECSQNYLLTFIEAYNPKIYEKYGFRTVSYRKKLHLSQKDIRIKDLKGISTHVDIDVMVYLYQEFAKRFDCYYIRDREYYLRYVEAIEKNGGAICMCYDEENQPLGYAVSYEKGDVIEVDEVIYLDSHTLSKLLRYSLQDKENIIVEVSSNERIEKIYKNIVPRTTSCVMARINNVPLYEKLYDVKIRSVDEAFYKLKKPVLLDEKC